MAKYYIAGPITGIEDSNHYEFVNESMRLTGQGHTAIIPTLLPDGLDQADYMQICIAMINVCTHVLFLRGWEKSEGARAEHAYAVKCGKFIEYQY